MPTSLPVLSQISIASPCPASWAEMAGDHRVRFCSICEKNVYNLSAMTAAEVESLVIEKEGRLCARFYQRQDGTVLTADCPVGVHHRIQRHKRLTGAAAALVSFVLGGCLPDSEPAGQTAQNRPTWLDAYLTPPKPQEYLGMVPPLHLPPQRALTGEVCIDPQKVPPPPVTPAQPQPRGVD